jgi:hypothetical protein
MLVSCSGEVVHLLKRPREYLCPGRLRFVKVRVEYHRDVTNENPSERRNFDALVVEPHQAVALKLSQLEERGVKMRVKVDSKSRSISDFTTTV